VVGQYDSEKETMNLHYNRRNLRSNHMKKSLFIIVLMMLWPGLTGAAGELKVGDKAPDFTLNDSLGKEYTLNSPELKGKVLSVFYVSPAEKDMNAHVEDALLKDNGLERNKRYKGLGISNNKASNWPNFVINKIIKSKQEKTGAIILVDENYTILNLWVLNNNSSNVIVLDKDRVCRYIYKGKLPLTEVTRLIQIIKEYQVK
jgi:predicted transcriptional regulator